MGKLLREKTKLFERKGATAVIFYNSSKTDDGIVFDPAEGISPEKIPALYVTKAGRKKYLRDISQSLDVEIDVEMEEKKRWGHNVIGVPGLWVHLIPLSSGRIMIILVTVKMEIPCTAEQKK